MHVAGRSLPPGQPGNFQYPGKRVNVSIRATGQFSLAGQPGNFPWPGNRAKTSIRAAGQSPASGQPGEKDYPGEPGKMRLTGQSVMCQWAGPKHKYISREHPASGTRFVTH